MYPESVIITFNHVFLSCVFFLDIVSCGDIICFCGINPTKANAIPTRQNVHSAQLCPYIFIASISMHQPGSVSAY